jgi:hypothetical protein
MEAVAHYLRVEAQFRAALEGLQLMLDQLYVNIDDANGPAGYPDRVRSAIEGVAQPLEILTESVYQWAERNKMEV